MTGQVKRPDCGQTGERLLPGPHDMNTAMGDDPFDEMAATWDADPAKIERAAAVARCIAAAVPIDSSTRMLEYGAGTGLVTQAMQDGVGPVTLVDTSRGMRDAIHAKIDAGSITDARVWALDLATESPPDEQFDLIVTVLTLHHITDLDIVLAGFARLLPTGGHLCIVDLDREDGSFHGEGFAGHHGFERPSLAAKITTHGFADISFTDCHHMVRDGVTYPLFLATARRGPMESPASNADDQANASEPPGDAHPE